MFAAYLIAHWTLNQIYKSINIFFLYKYKRHGTPHNSKMPNVDDIHVYSDLSSNYMEHKKQQKIENVFLFLQNAILQNLFSPFFVYFLRRLLALIIAGMHRAAKIRIQNSKIKIERNGEKKLTDWETMLHAPKRNFVVYLYPTCGVWVYTLWKEIWRIRLKFKHAYILPYFTDI